MSEVGPEHGQASGRPRRGAGPPPHKNKTYHFNLCDHENVKNTSSAVGGFVGVGWWGGRFEREARAVGVWGRSPQENVPGPTVVVCVVARLAAAVVVVRLP